MNLTYILGNGFDLNLGLKTSYKDFFEHYKLLNDRTPERQRFIEFVYNNTPPRYLWFDLEVLLGIYTKEFKDAESYLNIYFDIYKKLREYIKLNEIYLSSIKPETIETQKKKLFDYLKTPYFDFNGNEIEHIKSIFDNLIRSDININIINFNYTKTIERLTKDNFTIGGTNNYKYNISSIHHIHNNIESNILLGVNDVSQIANEKFRNIDLIKDVLVKPNSNDLIIGNGVDRKCRKIIMSSSVICLFGVSLGDTDKIWWQTLGKAVKDNNTIILYFVHDEEFKKLETVDNDRFTFYQREQKRKNCIELLDRIGLDKSKYNDYLNNRIFVKINSDIFKMDLQLRDIIFNLDLNEMNKTVFIRDKGKQHTFTLAV